MRRFMLAGYFVAAALMLPSASQAVTIDFETGTHNSLLPFDFYEPVGAHVFGGRIFEPPNDSWLSTSSGTRGMVPTLLA